MNVRSFLKHAGQAWPLVVAGGVVVQRLLEAKAALKGDDASVDVKAQPPMKSHHPDGGPIGYDSDNGQYLPDTHQYGGPTKH